ncbi:activating signal cointegrator 1 complex subunit 1 [Aethina tumida]|uniref:activating signal cointegrator 1 complex subunit 1 n=1 Tax=Aethina tumida TaxID=116153 RepID=UPI0021488B32|nr:activating signal cointegrator 1 complex subunit 1 [Aethina tumida]
MTKKTRRAFPDFFYSKDSLAERVTPLPLKNGTYFMLSVDEHQQQQDSNPSYYLPPYEDNDDGMIDCLDVEDYEIVQTKYGKFMTSFYVPGPLQSVIIGTGGKKLRMLEDRTNTKIKVPKTNETGDVKIIGNNERTVASARSQVALVVLTKREKLPVTHFISIPMTSPEIQKNFEKFRDEILNGPKTRGIVPSVFQSPANLHLTLTMLMLLDEKEIEEARQTLKICQQETIHKLFPRGQEHTIVVKGVEIMNDDPSDVHVLYGKIVQDEKLQQLADEIVSSFARKGFIKRQYDKVKLHVTLMNSVFNKNKETFDANDVLKKYENYYFGKTIFESVQLSIRFSFSSSGYYESACTIPVL